jgi:hypothetical protein
MHTTLSSAKERTMFHRDVDGRHHTKLLAIPANGNRTTYLVHTAPIAIPTDHPQLPASPILWAFNLPLLHLRHCEPKLPSVTLPHILRVPERVLIVMPCNIESSGGTWLGVERLRSAHDHLDHPIKREAEPRPRVSSSQFAVELVVVGRGKLKNASKAQLT